jgi:DNA-binding MarR family transcriptional regulator
MDKETAKYVAASCACFYFRSASRAITQIFDRALAPAGIRSTQLVVLVLLEAEGAMTFTALARLLVMDQTTFSRIANRLAESGWVKTSVNKADRRVRMMKLTAKGSHLIDKAAPYWKIAQGRVIENLGENEFSDLRTRLAKIGTLLEGKNENTDADSLADISS